MPNTPSKSLKHVLFGLNDREYYAVTDIVKYVFPAPSEREAAKAYRNRLYYIVKSKFPTIMHPDGELPIAGSEQTLPAWRGKNWKRMWAAYEERDREMMNQPHQGKQCTYPINAQVLILTLDPKMPYSAKDILAKAEEMNFLADLPDFKRRMEWQIRNFRRRYIKAEPDCYKFGGPAKEFCWLGVRWLKALPASYVGPELAQTIKRAEWEVKAHPPRSLFEHHIRFWRSMAAGLVLAFLAAWLFWYFRPENRQWRQYQQAIQTDGSQSLATLKQLWQQDHPAIEKVALAAHITAKFEQVGAYEDTDVVFLRQLLMVDGVDTRAIVDLIADVNLDRHRPTKFVEDIKHPVFVAAVQGNPFILFEEGMLQPGDWLVYKGDAGYIVNISARNIHIQFPDHEQSFRFNDLKLLNFPIDCEGPFRAWPGYTNLGPILSAIAEVNNLQTAWSLPLSGHLGGCSSAQNYNELLLELEQATPLDYDGTTIYAEGLPKYMIHLFPFPKQHTDHVAGFIYRFELQTGNSIRITNPLHHDDQTMFSLVNVSFDELCQTFGLEVKARDSSPPNR